MMVVRDDNRSLQVAQTHDVVAGIGVLTDVHDIVGESLLVERLVRRVALHTGGLGVDGDGHDDPFVVAQFQKAKSTQTLAIRNTRVGTLG